MGFEFHCFAEDARIDTAMGGVRAADLWEGDLVQTLDHGPQPVVRTARRIGPGRGAGAPVLFAPGAIGNHAPLKLSQGHRLLIRSARAELMFGEVEVLVPAAALINGVDVCFAPCARMGYVHVTLARHHILVAEGAHCESADVVQGRAARPLLSYDEAVALVGARPAQSGRPSFPTLRRVVSAVG